MLNTIRIIIPRHLHLCCSMGSIAGRAQPPPARRLTIGRQRAGFSGSAMTQRIGRGIHAGRDILARFMSASLDICHIKVCFDLCSTEQEHTILRIISAGSLPFLIALGSTVIHSCQHDRFLLRFGEGSVQELIVQPCTKGTGLPCHCGAFGVVRSGVQPHEADEQNLFITDFEDNPLNRRVIISLCRLWIMSKFKCSPACTPEVHSMSVSANDVTHRTTRIEINSHNTAFFHYDHSFPGSLALIVPLGGQAVK